MTLTTFRTSAVAAAIAAAFLFAAPAVFGQEAAQSSDKGTLTIHQEPISDLVGRWNLLKPYHESESGRAQEKVIEGWPGTYTVIIEPPKGAVARVRVLRGTEQIAQADRPQLTFVMNAGDDLRLSIHYSFEKTGEVSISSDPAGLNYLLEGPNATKYRGTTPGSYDTMPLGQYAVTFEAPAGCPPVPIKSQQLQENKRVSFHVGLECDAARAMREEQREMAANYVTVIADGRPIALTDVPQTAWFATYVFDAAKGGMIGGYKDENGEYTGKFGPENQVTVAELAKMAHRLGGVQEKEIEEPSVNPNVPESAWFAEYMASAEHRGWVIYADATIDPIRPATRAEVLVTLLQALDVPVHWPTGEVFTDVNWRTTPFAGVIETAAADGVVAGRTDDEGRPTGIFEPDAPVNRAEMATILVHAKEAYRM